VKKLPENFFISLRPKYCLRIKKKEKFLLQEKKGSEYMNDNPTSNDILIYDL